MQFLASGPHIPETLLEAHEDGRVIFFCGAGISYPAGLPGFKGLVNDIYKGIGAIPNLLEKEAFDKEKYDATLDLLERRIPGAANVVRKELAKSLRPKWKRPGATTTHEALLELGRSRAGPLRLVTTNFDRIFERAAYKKKLKQLPSYTAPMLPIPKSSRWDGVVYLHGQLPTKPDDNALRRLVITSGDFGLAYLTERWASRFVTELFRTFTVCFVGYSINDPVLRYMMDALAADRRLGESTPDAFAFGDFEPGKEKDKEVEWAAKGVTPILYEVPAGSNDHSLLHKTLHAWADTYRDGVLGKERIVANYALARPAASTRQDNFVGRMLWAISHDSGLPARHFAEFNPAPSLDWLKAFSDQEFTRHDLQRFGISPRKLEDEKLRFSLIERPTPYHLGPRMRLASTGPLDGHWDDVMSQIAKWLIRHLNDPKLLLWMANQGGRLHRDFEWMIERQLEKIEKLRKESNQSELERIRAQAPSAIPDDLMIRLWRLLLSGRIKAGWATPDLFQWKRRLSRYGLTATMRFELREILAPRIQLREKFRWHDGEPAEQAPSKIRDLIDLDLVLAADHVGSNLSELEDEQWKKALPELLDDFQQLLKDALDLMHELGEASSDHDRSVYDLPSICPHWQNRGFRDWATLIELVRDSWDAMRKAAPADAARVARAWFLIQYPTFKRLALYAASQEEGVPGHQWVEWLTSEGNRWLWATETFREVMRLLVLRGAFLEAIPLVVLERSILSGPPREMYIDDITPDRWQSIQDRAIWLRLEKLKVSGVTLGDAAVSALEFIASRHPQWRLADDERDEFSTWMSGTGDPGFQYDRTVELAPLSMPLLESWLQKELEGGSSVDEDNWRQLSRTHFYRTFVALRNLSKKDVWPIYRWRVALQGWGEQGTIMRALRHAPMLLLAMPAAVHRDLVSSISWWVETASKAKPDSTLELIPLVQRILSLPPDSAKSGDNAINWQAWEPVTEAINHPVGHATQALLNIWFVRELNDNDRLPRDIAELFSLVCDTPGSWHRHGRVVLAANLIALFRVDKPWTLQHLLPYFSWTHDRQEARAAWEGFLWSPRLYGRLMLALKPDFLETASHYADLGEHRRQFVMFMTYASLSPLEGFEREDFRRPFESLPPEALQQAAQALTQAQEGAGDQREDYWKNRLRPFWREIWPKSEALRSPNLSESLARICLATGAEFSNAVNEVLHWLRPLEHPHYVIHKLSESGLCVRFPDAALQLLGAIVSDLSFVSEELMKCLKEIRGAKPALGAHETYKRLEELYRRKGG